MTKAEMVTLLGYRLGDRDDTGGRIVAELPYVQEYILEAKEWLPWFLLKESAGMTVTLGSRAVEWPADFLLEEETGHLYLTKAGEIVRELRKMDFDAALAKYPGDGEPMVYSVAGAGVQLFPIPQEVCGLHLTYYGKDESLVSGSSPKWLQYAGDVVAAEVGKILAEKHIKDANAAAVFAADAQAAWTRLYHKHIAIKELNSSSVMNGD